MNSKLVEEKMSGKLSTYWHFSTKLSVTNQDYTQLLSTVGSKRQTAYVRIKDGDISPSAHRRVSCRERCWRLGFHAICLPDYPLFGHACPTICHAIKSLTGISSLLLKATPREI